MSIDWTAIRLVAFDVDGTLYRQRSVRLRMALALVRHCVRSRSLRTLQAVRLYRTLREQHEHLSDKDFESVLVGRVAEQLKGDALQVREWIRHWMQERPLEYLSGAQYVGVDDLFATVRSSGRKIGILSDYPAIAKLGALRLSADHIVCAEDVGALKPSPDGLLHLMRIAGETVGSTILIGDRADRDGAAARSVGVPVLLRSEKPIAGYPTFRRYDDGVFSGLRSPV